MPTYNTLHCAQHTHLNAPSYAYLFSEPQGAGAAPLPLIVFLHGRGEIGGALNRLEDFGPLAYQKQHTLDAYTLSPHVPAGRMGWDPGELDSLLDSIIAHYPIDTSRIYLTGLSMGGFGAINWALYQPQRFAALAAIAGGDPECLLPWAQNLPARPFNHTLYERLNALSIYLAHGLKDDIVPASLSTELFDNLSRLERSASLCYYQDPLAAHPVWESIYASSAFWQYLLEQRNTQQVKAPSEPSELRHYCGHYAAQGAQAIEIVLENNNLYLSTQNPNGEPLYLPLYALSEDRFTSSIGSLHFIRQNTELTQLALARLSLLNKMPN